MDYLYEQIEFARTHIVTQSSLVPRVGLILGSGLGSLAEQIDQPTIIPYSDIPGFQRPAVVGHHGELVLGLSASLPVAVLRGRFHFYEGHSMQQITFPVRVLRALGCEMLFVTNAAGGLIPAWQVGDIMAITDHLFLPGMAGHHPLRGPNDDRLGPRFPAMLHAYDPLLIELALTTAQTQNLTLRQGIYAMLSGPAFETGAELRMLQILGASAVGMSTAPEVIVARHAGMRVLGLSLITNMALPDGSPANHEEVITAGVEARPRFGALVQGILESLAEAE